MTTEHLESLCIHWPEQKIDLRPEEVFVKADGYLYYTVSTNGGKLDDFTPLIHEAIDKEWNDRDIKIVLEGHHSECVISWIIENIYDYPYEEKEKE